MKTAMLAVARNEQDYVVEWLTHHRDIGIDRVFLCDNGDRPLLHDIVAKQKLDGFCSVIDDYIGRRDNIQPAAYTRLYEAVKNDYDWLLVADLDEFLMLDEDIVSFLSDRAFDGFNEIRINWRVFGDCGLVHYDKAPVISRFKTPLPKSHPYNRQCKSFIRGGLDQKVRIICHGSPDLVACDVFGNPCENFKSCNEGPPIWERAVINHYRTKTIEEFMMFKENRGDSWNSYIKSLDSMFFYVNEKTAEKMSVVEKYRMASV